MSITIRSSVALGIAGLLAAAALIAVPAGAQAGSLSSRLSHKRHHLQTDRSRQAALAATIERDSRRIDNISGEVARLQDQQVQVQAQLDRKQAQLDRAKAKLARVKGHLHDAMTDLKERLVASYEVDRPAR